MVTVLSDCHIVLALRDRAAFFILKKIGFMETENTSELQRLINHKNLTLYDEKNYFSSLHKKKRFHIQLPKHKS